MFDKFWHDVGRCLKPCQISIEKPCLKKKNSKQTKECPNKASDGPSWLKKTQMPHATQSGSTLGTIHSVFVHLFAVDSTLQA